MLALSDGMIVTKDLRLEGQGGTTLTRLEPGSLEVLGEPLVISDFRPGEGGGPPSDDLVVVDVATGALVDRVSTGSRVANGMFLSAARDRRVLYASTTAVALVAWI